MNHSKQFLRSVNTYKITDGEYIDMYVNMYIYLNEIFKDLELFECFEVFTGSIFHGTSSENLLLEEDIDLDILWIDRVIYLKFKKDFYIGNYIIDEHLDNILHIYFNIFMNFKYQRSHIRNLNIKKYIYKPIIK